MPINRFGGVVLVSVVSAAVIVTAPSAGADPRPSEKVDIDIISVKGSGCQTDSVVAAVRPDNTAFTVDYRDLGAEEGKDIGPSRTTCELRLRVNVPPGFTYGIDEAEIEGVAVLADGARGGLEAAFSFQGLSPLRLQRNFIERADYRWEATGGVLEGSVRQLRCDQKLDLVLTTDLWLDSRSFDPGRSRSWVKMDRSLLRISWKKCQ
ncbi:uncharacterized protein DUF4360 [Nocardia tenerifensis]|uniref:Uncharacterized protein DUF4360 n=1 Tax=Nocardia tenerifensis TaxID=228006 RepID=A0A318JMZ6_9NOCA|nr:DUF4360 domain-containing protein [Nocardia tenerifensis]PXX52177.1 uncharacterized protein DUF4360 [Nocardia tenerifensis]